MPKPILTGYELVTQSVATTTPTQLNAPPGMFVAWAFARDEDLDGRILDNVKMEPVFAGSSPNQRITGMIFTLPAAAGATYWLVCVGQ